jgi:hypothetical protein
LKKENKVNESANLFVAAAIQDKPKNLFTATTPAEKTSLFATAQTKVVLDKDEGKATSLFGTKPSTGEKADLISENNDTGKDLVRLFGNADTQKQDQTP